MTHATEAATENPILTHQNGPVTEIQLNRPHRKNAVTVELIDQLRDVLTTSESDAACAAVLLYGADGTLCSGVDIKAGSVASVGPAWQRLHRSIAAMRTPLVIAHEGAAINAGSALALSADLLVSGRTAFLQIMEARLGMAPPVNLAWLLHRHSRSVAERLALSCDRVTGAELLTLGISHAVVDDDAVVERAREVAQQLAEYPNSSATTVKSLLTAAGRATGARFDDILDAIIEADAHPTKKGSS